MWYLDLSLSGVEIDNYGRCNTLSEPFHIKSASAIGSDQNPILSGSYYHATTNAVNQ